MVSRLSRHPRDACLLELFELSCLRRVQRRRKICEIDMIDGGSTELNSRARTPPRVTVITIFLDAERYLDEAIMSVLRQDLPDWELLLVDDGSSDRSTTIALDYTQRFPDKIIYLEHEGHANRGMSASRNLGIR